MSASLRGGSGVRTLELKALCELRIEAGFENHVSIKLIQGECEVNGIELAVQRQNIFAGCRCSVLSWRGCSIEIDGEADSIYVSEKNSACVALNVHAYCEWRREEAATALSLAVVGNLYPGNDDSVAQEIGIVKNGTPQLLPARPTIDSPSIARFVPDAEASGIIRGPRVLVCGGEDSGKSTLCRTLAAYAARAGREAMLIDLDPSLNDSGVPTGVLTALSVTKSSLSVEQGFTGMRNAPLCFWYGHASPESNSELYKHVLRRLALCVTDRLALDPKANAAGLIINTCGWVDGVGVDLLKYAASVFAVDIVLVLSHDRLYNDLNDAFKPYPNVVVTNLSRSGGAVSRNIQYRRKLRHKHIHEYFYGPLSHFRSLATKRLGASNPILEHLPSQLAPAGLELRFRDIKLYRVITSRGNIDDSMLPVGQGTLLDPLQVVVHNITPDLVHTVLAVCHPRESTEPAPNGYQLASSIAERHDSENNPYHFLLDSSAAGFVVVTSVNLDKGTVTLLTPCSGDLPSPHLLLGDIEWVEGLLA